MDSLKLSLYTSKLVARDIKDAFIVFTQPGTDKVVYKCTRSHGVAYVKDASGTSIARLSLVFSTDGSAPTYKVEIATDSAPLILITPHTAKGRRCLLALWDIEQQQVRCRMTAPWLHSDCEATTGPAGHDAPLFTVTSREGNARLAQGRLNTGLFASFGLIFSPDDAWSYAMDITNDPAQAPLAVAAVCAVVLATVAEAEEAVDHYQEVEEPAAGEAAAAEGGAGMGSLAPDGTPAAAGAEGAAAVAPIPHHDSEITVSHAAPPAPAATAEPTAPVVPNGTHTAAPAPVTAAPLTLQQQQQYPDFEATPVAAAAVPALAVSSAPADAAPAAAVTTAKVAPVAAAAPAAPTPQPAAPESSGGCVVA